MDRERQTLISKETLIPLGLVVSVVGLLVTGIVFIVQINERSIQCERINAKQDGQIETQAESINQSTIALTALTVKMENTNSLIATLSAQIREFINSR